MRDRSRLIGWVALLAAAHTAVFLYAAPRADKDPPWAPNSMLLNVTASGLQHQQHSLSDSLQVIRSQFDPRDSVVLTLIGQDPYRFMMYYLPDYLVLDLDPAAPVVVSARGRRQGQRQLVGWLPVRQWRCSPRAAGGVGQIGAGAGAGRSDACLVCR